VRKWVRGGADGGMRWRKGRLSLYCGRRMRCRWTAGRASVIFTASDARSRALPYFLIYVCSLSTGTIAQQAAEVAVVDHN
jgi:hypothetical protein